MSEEQIDKILMKLTGIENCLLGNEYERNNGGGLIKRVDKNCKSIAEIKEETRAARWFQRNPGKALIIIFAFILTVVVAFTFVDLKATLKNRTGIELKDK